MKIFFTVIISCVIAFNASAADPFIWADDEDYRPYIYQDENTVIKGIFRDIMVEAFKRMDIPLQASLYPWTRAQHLVKIGKADGMVTIPTEKRLAFLNATDPLVSANARVFVKNDNPRLKELQALRSYAEFKDFRVVDYIGDGWAEKVYKDMDIIWSSNSNNCIVMLAKNRADIFVSNEFVGFDKLRWLLENKSQHSSDLEKIIALPHIFETVDYTLLINKNSKYIDIIPRFNEVLRQMKKDGTHDTIVKNYYQ